MGNVILLAIILGVLIVMTNLFGKEKKVTGKCKTCPEFRYCGGGKPRCARRSESK